MNDGLEPKRSLCLSVELKGEGWDVVADLRDMKKNECVTVKEAYNMYLGELAKKAGKDAPEDFMRRAKESGILPDRKSLSRLKEKVYGVGGSSARQNPGGLIEELNKKILDSDE